MYFQQYYEEMLTKLCSENWSKCDLPIKPQPVAPTEPPYPCSQYFKSLIHQNAKLENQVKFQNFALMENQKKLYQLARPQFENPYNNYFRGNNMTYPIPNNPPYSQNYIPPLMSQNSQNYMPSPNGPFTQGYPRPTEFPPQSHIPKPTQFPVQGQPNIPKPNELLIQRQPCPTKLTDSAITNKHNLLKTNESFSFPTHNTKTDNEDNNDYRSNTSENSQENKENLPSKDSPCNEYVCQKQKENLQTYCEDHTGFKNDDVQNYTHHSSYNGTVNKNREDKNRNCFPETTQHKPDISLGNNEIVMEYAVGKREDIISENATSCDFYYAKSVCSETDIEKSTDISSESSG